MADSDVMRLYFQGEQLFYVSWNVSTLFKPTSNSFLEIISQIIRLFKYQPIIIDQELKLTNQRYCIIRINQSSWATRKQN